MIKVFFFRENKYIKGFEIKGHSNFYKSLLNKVLLKFGIKRKDYICSAVSAISYMTVIGLSKVLKKDIEYKEENNGHLICKLRKKPDNESENLFKTFLLTLEEIDKKYPNNINIEWRWKYGT